MVESAMSLFDERSIKSANPIKHGEHVIRRIALKYKSTNQNRVSDHRRKKKEKEREEIGVH